MSVVQMTDGASGDGRDPTGSGGWPQTRLAFVREGTTRSRFHLQAASLVASVLLLVISQPRQAPCSPHEGPAM